MRIIVISLCVLIAILTAQNHYLQQNLQAAFEGDYYSSKMLETYAKEIYEIKKHDEQK
jgi:hypothetical protein